MSNKTFTKKLTKYVIWHKTQKKFLAHAQFWGYSSRLNEYVYEVTFLDYIEPLTSWEYSCSHKSDMQLKLNKLKNGYIAVYGSCFDKLISFNDLEIRKMTITYEMD